MKLYVFIVLVWIGIATLIAAIESNQAKANVSDITLIPHSDCSPNFKDVITYKEPQIDACVGIITVRQA